MAGISAIAPERKAIRDMLVDNGLLTSAFKINPKYLQVGIATVTGFGTTAVAETKSAAVMFPNAFDNTPKIFAMAATSYPAVVNAIAMTNGATGLTIYASKTAVSSGSSLSVMWLAIDPEHVFGGGNTCSKARTAARRRWAA
jgi:hypothetical protein